MTPADHLAALAIAAASLPFVAAALWAAVGLVVEAVRG